MSSAALMHPTTHQKKTSSLVSAISWLILACIVAFSIWSLKPPKAISADAPPDTFSAQRASLHLENIARAPHPIGTPEHDRVRNYLVSELTKLGTNPSV